MSTLAPIQEGANRVLKPVPGPVRLVRGHGATPRTSATPVFPTAKHRDRLAPGAAAALRRSPPPGLNEQDTTGGMDEYAPVDARVFVHSPSAWYQR